MNDEIDKTSDLVLFHRMPATVQPQRRQDIIDLLLIFKHVIYGTRFRQNQNRQPTKKLITISITSKYELASKFNILASDFYSLILATSQISH